MPPNISLIAYEDVLSFCSGSTAQDSSQHAAPARPISQVKPDRQLVIAKIPRSLFFLPQC
jgi:hypothetical protein